MTTTTTTPTPTTSLNTREETKKSPGRPKKEHIYNIREGQIAAEMGRATSALLRRLDLTATLS